LDALGITYKDIDLFVYSSTEQLDNVANQFRKVTNNSSKLLFIPHHLAHAYSSFFSSGFDDAAGLVCDASGSILNYQNKLHKWYDGEKLGLDKSIISIEKIIQRFIKNGFRIQSLLILTMTYL
jgi:predicted NodU family carbamoyl transferase